MTPDRYAVVGNPIDHSKSPEIHARFAMQTRQNLVYERLLAPLDGFAACIRSFTQQGGRGVNVTLPFKLDAYGLASTLTERARAAGAVNTLTFDAGAILGDNTDGAGLVRDITHNAGLALAGKKILLLGAGGAARGVILPILNEEPATLTIANRTHSTAQRLAQQFAGYGNIAATNFAGLEGPFDLVINATSASLKDEVPPIPPASIGLQSLAYDMMYGTSPTVFMRFASRHGAAVRDGLGMLVEQAAESFFAWRGVRPDTAPVFAALRANL